MSGFHFTSEQPDQQLFTDVQNLNEFSDDQLQGFVACTLAFLSSDPNAEQMVESFAATHQIKAKALKSTIGGVILFFGEALKRNNTPSNVQEDLIKLGLNDDKAAMLAERWKAKFVTLSESMIAKTLNVNELVDLEWKFGVTAANGEMSQVGACFLQLKLVLARGNGERESVLMELTLPQFYQFLQQMQAASAHSRVG